MSFTIIGVLWIGALIFLLYQPIRYMKAITIMSFIFQGLTIFTIHATETDVLAIYVSVLFLLIKTLLDKKKWIIQIDGASKWLIIFYITICVLSVITTNVFSGYQVEDFSIYNQVIYTRGYSEVFCDTKLFVQFAFLGIYVLGFVLISQGEEVDKEVYVKMIRFAMIIVFVAGCIQYLETNNYIDTEITRILFHNQLYQNKSSASIYDSYRRVYATFAEPSYCGPWVNACIWFLLDEKNRKNLIYLIMMFLIFCFSLSGAGMCAFICCIGIYFIKSKDKKILKNMLIVLFVLAVMLIVTPIGQEMIVQFVNKISTNSGVARDYSNQLALRAFAASYGLGIGYSKVTGMTLFHCLLGQVGVIGLFIFMKFAYETIRKTYRCNQHYASMSRALLIAVYISVIFSCPGLIYDSVLWFGLYLNQVLCSTGNIYRTRDKLLEYADEEKVKNG